MRADLNKLLCERERRKPGKGLSYRHFRHKKQFTPQILQMDIEDGGTGHEGMTHRYGWDQKDFSENLRPLYGQIRKAVGRRWDAFYSDLCKVFDMRSVINQHILQHLKDYCDRDVYLRDGTLYKRAIYGPDIPLRNSPCEFYVDPRDGIIKRNKYRITYRQLSKQHNTRKAIEQSKVTRWIDENTVLRKVVETWFVFDVLPIPETPVFDCFLQRQVSRERWSSNTYHARKVTAARKLLRKYGIVR